MTATLTRALVALALTLCLLGAAILGRACQQTRPPPPPPAPTPPAPAPPDELAELSVLLDLATSTTLAARLACSLPATGDEDDREACGDALSRVEAGLLVAEGARATALACEARGDRGCRSIALGVARQQLPGVRQIVASRGLAPAPAGSR